RGLTNALGMRGEDIVAAVTDSGLRGRGGAAFPTGIKWKTVLTAPAEQKYVVCNADEGDSGTFADRMIMESDPFVLIEGMTIAGLAVGAAGRRGSAAGAAAGRGRGAAGRRGGAAAGARGGGGGGRGPRRGRGGGRGAGAGGGGPRAARGPRPGAGGARPPAPVHDGFP